MQTNCPKCSNRLSIDDAKIPVGQFVVKCPGCQTAMKIQGRPLDSAPTEKAAPDSDATPPAGSPGPPPVAAPPLPAAEPGSAGRALIAFASESTSRTADELLTRLGFIVDPITDPDAPVRLDQGDYDLVSTTSNGLPEAHNIYSRVMRFPPERRRRTFVILVGEEFRTDEGSQAWVNQADLVVHPSELAGADRLISLRLGEKERLYRTFLDVEDRRDRGEL